MINKILRKLLYGNKADSKTYIEYLRSLGMKIGEETTIYVPTKTQIALLTRELAPIMTLLPI